MTSDEAHIKFMTTRGDLLVVGKKDVRSYRELPAAKDKS